MSMSPISAASLSGSIPLVSNLQPLRVLVLEDDSLDARLIVDHLRQAGYEPEWQRVDTEQDFVAQLNEAWDLILADYALPQFDAIQALRHVRALGLDVPFLIVSGSIGEETAVAAMKEGATDYLLKDRLGRLGTAVAQAFEQKRLREAQRHAVQALRESRERMRQVIETAYDPFVAADVEGRITEWNMQAESVFGWTRAEALGRTLTETIIPACYHEAHNAGVARFLATGKRCLLKRQIEVTAQHKSGRLFPIELMVWPIEAGESHAFCAFLRDITVRKQAEETLRERTQLIMLSAEVASALNRGCGVRDTLQQCAAALTENLAAVQARIWTYNEDDRVLELQAAAGLDTRLDGQFQRVPLGAYKIGRVAAERHPVLVNDVSKDPHLGDQNWMSQQGIVSFAAYPLIAGDRLTGAMAIFSRQTLTPATLDALGTAANQIAAGIERQNVEQRLRFTQFTIDHVATAVFWSDSSGRFFNVNDAACRLTGYSHDELLKLHVHDLDVSIAPGNWSAVWNKLRERRTATSESRIRRKDRIEVPVSINSNFLTTRDHEYSCTFVQDIIERKAAEFAQRQSELRFRAIFDQTFEFVALVNVDGTVLELNQPALDFAGLTMTDVAGLFLWETLWLGLSGDTPAVVRRAIAEAAAGRFARHEITVQDAHHGALVFDFSVKPCMNDAGRAELLIVEARDITEQKRLEQQFRQAQKMEAIGKLAGGVAHDFNNLLTIILGYSEMLQESLHGHEQWLDVVAQIHRAGERAASLTRQLLAFSRKQVLLPVVTNLNVLLGDMQKMLDRLIGEDVELCLTLATDPWPVRVDPGQMEQVIMNLVVNARDAMPQGGTLTIKTANQSFDAAQGLTVHGVAPGQYVQLSVSDTGCGMDAATLAQVFEPFFSTKGENGTGLGLATVYGIVKQSGGHIAVQSEPGRGACFQIYLPRDASQVDRLAESGVSTPLEGHETILLVEDDEVVRGLARAILQRHGYKVLEACHGEEALGIHERYDDDIHLLITDVIMPKMSGRELTERLCPLRQEMKVLYMSGYMDDAVVRQGLASQSDAFLQKPFSPGRLIAKVRELLS